MKKAIRIVLIINFIILTITNIISQDKNEKKYFDYYKNLNIIRFEIENNKITGKKAVQKSTKDIKKIYKRNNKFFNKVIEGEFKIICYLIKTEENLIKYYSILDDKPDTLCEPYKKALKNAEKANEIFKNIEIPKVKTFLISKAINSTLFTSLITNHLKNKQKFEICYINKFNKCIDIWDVDSLKRTLNYIKKSSYSDTVEILENYIKAKIHYLQDSCKISKKYIYLSNNLQMAYYREDTIIRFSNINNEDCIFSVKKIEDLKSKLKIKCDTGTSDSFFKKKNNNIYITNKTNILKCPFSYIKHIDSLFIYNETAQSFIVSIDSTISFNDILKLYNFKDTNLEKTFYKTLKYYNRNLLLKTMSENEYHNLAPHTIIKCNILKLYNLSAFNYKLIDIKPSIQISSNYIEYYKHNATFKIIDIK